MPDKQDQAKRLRTIAADTRSAAERAGQADRVALLRSARGFEWAAEALESATGEDASPSFLGHHPANFPRR
jgi:hypothetical protein